MRKRYLTAVIALVLTFVLLFNITACNGKDGDTAGTCTPHTYADWIVDTPASCINPGKQHHVCSQCGHREDDDINALGHSFVNGVCLRCNTVESEEGLAKIPVNDVAKIRLTASQPIAGQALTPSTEVDAMIVNSYNASVEKSSDFGISSYKTDSLSVAFDSNVDGYSVMDTLTVDDEISVEQAYYIQDGELALGEIYADYYEVEIDYTDDGKVSGLYYYDTYYIYKYDGAGRLTEIYKDGELYKKLTYNANGNIITELTKTQKGDLSEIYRYTTGGALYSVGDTTIYEQYSENDGTVTANGRSYALSSDEVIVSGDRSATFIYEYEFNGTEYITSKTIDGHETTYAYVGDRLVSLCNDYGSIEYILDNELNYIGLKFEGEKYYFAVDPYGNVMAILDSDGDIKVSYEHDIWGNVLSVEGELSDSLGKVNEIVNLNGIYDFELGVYHLAEGIYIPAYGITLRKNTQTVNQVKSMYEWEQNGYFARSAVTSFACIHDKVVEVVVENLKEQGMDVVSNLYAVDQAGNSKRLVDIYTLDYSITPFSAMNLVDGNQIYEVIYKSQNSNRYFERAQDKLNEICKSWSVSYFAEYTPVAGTMDFSGQFIYKDKLISYQTETQVGGIVSYEILNNEKKNYDQSVNIFNYDTNRYVNYVNNTFDLEFLDGVTIIPGISRETYDKIDGFLSDQLQSVAGNICDQMLIYDDPDYYKSLEANQAKDYWSQMNLGPDATTSYLEIQADGSVQVKTMPVWETDGFMTKLLIGAGVILVTAVVATIAVSVPGLNCVVVSICVGAAKGAVAGALSGFAFGAVSGAAGELIGQLASGQTVDWEKIANAAAGAAADGFMSGAITGAIMGGIQGGLNPTYCFEAGTPVKTAAGTVAIENIAVGDQVLSYDYVTGQQSYKTVTETSVRQTNELVALTVGGEQIVTTPRHPFYVVNDDTYHGYTAAEYLSEGDCILTADGGYATITAIEREIFEEPISVYNFTVEDNHSYYVGENEVLAHNGGCETNVKSNVSNVTDKQASSIYDDLTENIDDLLTSREGHLLEHSKSSAWRSFDNGKLYKHDTKYLSDNISDIKDTIKSAISNHSATLESFDALQNKYTFNLYSVGKIGTETLANNGGLVFAENLKIVVKLDTRTGELILKTIFPFV